MKKFNVSQMEELNLQGGSFFGNLFHAIGSGIHNVVSGATSAIQHGAHAVGYGLGSVAHFFWG